LVDFATSFLRSVLSILGKYLASVLCQCYWVKNCKSLPQILSPSVQIARQEHKNYWKTSNMTTQLQMNSKAVFFCPHVSCPGGAAKHWTWPSAAHVHHVPDLFCLLFLHQQRFLVVLDPPASKEGAGIDSANLYRWGHDV
jgi:hypothetical protein